MRMVFLLAAALSPASLLGAQAAPLARLGFEESAPTGGEEWTVVRLPRGGELRIDSVNAHGGAWSVRLSQGNAGDRAVVARELRLPLPVDAVEVRLSGWVRTEGVVGSARIGIVALGPDYLAMRERPPYAAAASGGAPELLSLADGRSADVSGTNAWTRLSAVVPVVPGIQRLDVGLVLAGTGAAWFDDMAVEWVPGSAFPAPSDSVTAYVNAALDSIQRHLLGRAQVDWPAFRTRIVATLRGAQTPAEAYPSLTLALRTLNPHSGFFTPARFRDFSAAHEGDGEHPPELPSGSMLGRAGYLRVPGITSLSSRNTNRYAAAAHRALDAQWAAKACGYVVDLRDNRGGFDVPMLAAVQPFLFGELREENGKTYAAGRLWTADDTVVVARPAPLRLDAPVAVLIGPRTGSSGEGVVLWFVGRPNTRTFGLPTAGFTTGNEFFMLRDGAALNVTTEVGRDRTGREYGGRIEPDVRVQPVPPGQQLPLGAQPEVKAALEWLVMQPGCRGR